MSGDDLPGESGEKSIDTRTAMKYSAVFACNRVLSETLASMPIMEYRKKPDGTREQTSDTAAYDILHNAPNEEMSPFNFKECCMGAINLGGNSVSQRLVNKRKELVGLYPFEHQRVRIERDKTTKKLIYTVKDGVNAPIFQRGEVFHIPGPSLNGVVGLSPIEYVASAIRLGLSYEKFGVNFYKNGANSSGGFSIPGELGEEAFNRLKKTLAENYTGLKNTGKPMLLEGGLTFQPWTIKPVDAQLIENKRFQKEDIASIYRVPMHMIQDLSHATFSNIENLSLQFVVYTMLPHFKRWEENINAQLLPLSERKAGYYLEFKVDSLLRGDMKSRSEAYAAGRTGGWLSVNDIRKLENMAPIPNGDIYMMPLNFVEAGKQESAQQQSDNTKALAEKIFNMIKERE
jgi:HK97 family phage portal protein